MLRWLCVVVCCYTSYGFCAEMMPWFGDRQELEFRCSYRYQNYSRVNSDAETDKYSSDDSILQASLSTACIAYCSLEVELEGARTTHHSIFPNSVGLMLRCLWWDDIVGDPFSVTTGLGVFYHSRNALRDLSMPFHGDVEVEGHVSIGKEYTQGRYWVTRWWMMGRYGLGNKGLPWVGGSFTFECNSVDQHQGGIFVDCLHGLGDRKLVVGDAHRGYGSINHQSVDGGIRYRYVFTNDSMVTIQYTRRIHARSMPKDVDMFTIAYYLPFSVV